MQSLLMQETRGDRIVKSKIHRISTGENQRDILYLLMTYHKEKS